MAIITHKLLEGARSGRSVSDLMTWVTIILTREDIREGISEMIRDDQVDASFRDGTEFVTVHHPIRSKLTREPRRTVTFRGTQPVECGPPTVHLEVTKQSHSGWATPITLWFTDIELGEAGLRLIAALLKVWDRFAVVRLARHTS